MSWDAHRPRLRSCSFCRPIEYRNSAPVLSTRRSLYAALKQHREIYVVGRKIIGRRMACFDRAHCGRRLRENAAVVDDFQMIAHRLGDARPRERPDTLLPGQAWVWNGISKCSHDVLQSVPGCISDGNLQGRKGDMAGPRNRPSQQTFNLRRSRRRISTRCWASAPTHQLMRRLLSTTLLTYRLKQTRSSLR